MVDLLQHEHRVDVEWRPYYLQPDTPPEGMDLPAHVLRARAAGSEQRLEQIARTYKMEFKSTQRYYNTRLAHEATEYARTCGKANEFHRIVFQRVYARGSDPSKWAVLRAAAVEAGLDEEEMQHLVERGEFTQHVAALVEQAYEIGVSGVPTYVINGRYAIVGAQPYEVFQRALKQIMNEPPTGS